MKYNSVAVISCGRRKNNFRTQAKNLYTGNLFIAARKFCECNYSDWIILSAKYGVLFPEQMVEPYDLFIDDFTEDEKINWSNTVANKIMKMFDSNKTIDFYTSKNYQKYVIPILTRGGYSTTENLNNLRVALKTKWFLEHSESNHRKLF